MVRSLAVPSRLYTFENPEQLVHRSAQGLRAFLPPGDSMSQARPITFALRAAIRRAHVQRDAQIGAVPDDLTDCGHSRETLHVVEGAVGADDPLDMGVPQEALRPLPRHLLDRVYEEDLTLPLWRLVRAADHDARLHRGVVEKVRAEAEDAFD